MMRKTRRTLIFLGNPYNNISQPVLPFPNVEEVSESSCVPDEASAIRGDNAKSDAPNVETARWEWNGASDTRDGGSCGACKKRPVVDSLNLSHCVQSGDHESNPKYHYNTKICCKDNKNSAEGIFGDDCSSPAGSFRQDKFQSVLKSNRSYPTATSLSSARSVVDALHNSQNSSPRIAEVSDKNSGSIRCNSRETGNNRENLELSCSSLEQQLSDSDAMTQSEVTHECSNEHLDEVFSLSAKRRLDGRKRPSCNTSLSASLKTAKRGVYDKTEANVFAYSSAATMASPSACSPPLLPTRPTNSAASNDENQRFMPILDSAFFTSEDRGGDDLFSEALNVHVILETPDSLSPVTTKDECGSFASHRMDQTSENCFVTRNGRKKQSQYLEDTGHNGNKDTPGQAGSMYAYSASGKIQRLLNSAKSRLEMIVAKDFERAHVKKIITPSLTKTRSPANAIRSGHTNREIRSTKLNCSLIHPLSPQSGNFDGLESGDERESLRALQGKEPRAVLFPERLSIPPPVPPNTSCDETSVEIRSRDETNVKKGKRLQPDYYSSEDYRNNRGLAVDSASASRKSTYEISADHILVNEMPLPNIPSPLQYLSTSNGANDSCLTEEASLTHSLIRKSLKSPGQPADAPGSDCSYVCGCSSSPSADVSSVRMSSLLSPCRWESIKMSIRPPLLCPFHERCQLSPSLINRQEQPTLDAVLTSLSLEEDVIELTKLNHLPENVSPPPSVASVFSILCNSLIGVGVLSLPFSFSLMGFSTLFLCACLTTLYCWSGELIIDSLRLSDTRADKLNIPWQKRDWQWLGYASFGSVGKSLFGVALAGELWIITTTYCLMAATCIKELTSSLAATHESFSLVVSTTQALSFVSIVVVLISCIPLRFLAPISVAANFAVLLLLGAFFVSVTETVYLRKTEHVTTAPLKFFDLAGMGNAVGLINFCFVAHAIFPSIYRSVTTHFSATCPSPPESPVGSPILGQARNYLNNNNDGICRATEATMNHRSTVGPPAASGLSGSSLESPKHLPPGSSSAMDLGFVRWSGDKKWRLQNINKTPEPNEDAASNVHSRQYLSTQNIEQISSSRNESSDKYPSVTLRDVPRKESFSFSRQSITGKGQKRTYHSDENNAIGNRASGYNDCLNLSGNSDSVVVEMTDFVNGTSDQRKEISFSNKMPLKRLKLKYHYSQFVEEINSKNSEMDFSAPSYFSSPSFASVSPLHFADCTKNPTRQMDGIQSSGLRVYPRLQSQTNLRVTSDGMYSPDCAPDSTITMNNIKCFNLHASHRSTVTFVKALRLAYLVAFVAYGGTGLMGYVGYGKDLAVLLTLNIGKDADGLPLAGWGQSQQGFQLAQATLIVKLFLQLPLLLIPLTQSVMSLSQDAWRQMSSLFNSFLSTIRSRVPIFTNSHGGFLSRSFYNSNKNETDTIDNEAFRFQNICHGNSYSNTFLARCVAVGLASSLGALVSPTLLAALTSFAGLVFAAASCLTFPVACYLRQTRNLPSRKIERAGLWFVLCLAISIHIYGIVSAISAFSKKHN